MAKLNKDIFKAYDIRGTYPDEFDENAAYLIARAFAKALKAKTAVVGHDMRTSWGALMPELVRGLHDSGVDVWDVGLVSTPLYYHCVNSLKGDVGLMLTASHNPGQYNGLKPTGPDAIPSIAFVSNEDIWRMAEAEDFDTPAAKGKTLGQRDLLDEYVAKVIETIGVSSFGGLKAVMDTGNGMGGHVLPALTRALKADVVPLYWDVDGTFPNHEANPLKESTLDDLKRKVVVLVLSGLPAFGRKQPVDMRRFFARRGFLRLLILLFRRLDLVSLAAGIARDERRGTSDAFGPIIPC